MRSTAAWAAVAAAVGAVCACAGPAPTGPPQVAPGPGLPSTSAHGSVEFGGRRPASTTVPAALPAGRWAYQAACRGSGRVAVTVQADDARAELDLDCNNAPAMTRGRLETSARAATMAITVRGATDGAAGRVTIGVSPAAG